MTMNSEMMARIAAHYNHAKRKHPYFADRLSVVGKSDVSLFRDSLSHERSSIKSLIANNHLAGEHLLQCKLEKMLLSVADDDKPSAVDAAYDVIAVLLRMIDVMEGRQKLGRPKEVKA